MTDPLDQIFGQPRRYLRFVYEFEIEVTDPVQAKAFTMDVFQDESGEMAMWTRQNQNEQMLNTVGRVIAQALHASGEQAGFRLLSGSTLPRTVGDDGQHIAMTLPPMPARDDNGNME